MSETPEQTEAPGAGQAPLHPLRPSTLRRIGIVTAVVALLIVAAGIVDRQLNAREVARWTAAEAIPSVSIIVPERGGSAAPLVLPGNIEAWNEAPIYARVSGYLKKWYFDYGAHVKAGQILATIDTPDLDAQFAAARADLVAAQARVKVAQAQSDFAKTTYDRWRDSPKGVVSAQETESKKADYQTALANYDATLANVQADQGAVDRLRALEQFKNIAAPFSGVVTARNTDIGALIDAGSGTGGGNAPQLFSIADIHEMRVYVQVPQAMSGRITPGMSAQLVLPQYPDRTFNAIVATTADAINTTSRTLLVELHADNPNGVLQSGTYAEVHFNLKPQSGVLTIPATALIFQQNGMQVAVVGPNDRAQMRTVTLGRNFGTDVEILKGLSPGDRVIDSPPDSLSNGELVSVVNPVAPSAGDLARVDGKAVDPEERTDPPAGAAHAGQPQAAR
ncbi:MAG TPA: efflux RND transporter periplasmic adaptor subunit [Steroidobacteraceae bacterium]|nr:efflux RND transporter periplasmic adaptor subunit [Steroidobacteraceae bacterium]